MPAEIRDSRSVGIRPLLPLKPVSGKQDLSDVGGGIGVSEPAVTCLRTS